MDKNEEKLAKQQAKIAQKKLKARAKLVKKKEKTQAKLDKLMLTMSSFNLQVEDLRDELLANDGKIDAAEQKRLDKIDKRIMKVISKIKKLLAKMPQVAAVSEEDKERAEMRRRLQSFNGELEAMILAYGTSNNQHPTLS